MEPDIEQKTLIVAKVSDPLTDVAGGYTTYLVSGTDDHGTYQIRRRFNDFFYFRESLKKKWPGLYIPPIPQKQIIGNKDDQNIQIRRKLLNYFINMLANMKHLFYCTVTQQFIRNKQIDMEKYYQTLGSNNLTDLIAQFQKYCAETKISVGQAKNVTATFTAFLKKAEKQLKTMKSQVSSIVQSRNCFMENLNKCTSTLLPQYQKNIYAQYLQGDKKQSGLIFVNDFKVQDNIRNLRDQSTPKDNPFDLCLDMLSFQSREVEAMQQAILLRDNYEIQLKKLEEKCLNDQAEMAKLSGGKTTLKSIFSKGSKNQQIQIFEKSIPQTQKQIELMKKLNQLMNIALGSIEIPRFKKQKQIQYYEVMGNISNKQLKYLFSYGQLMKSVMEALKKSALI